MTSPKDHNTFLVINPKDIEICDLVNKEFKIAILNKLSQLQVNTERKGNGIRKIMHKQYKNLIDSGI